MNEEEKVLLKVGCDGKDNCWEWNGSILNSGYGQIYYNRRRLVAHRAVYIILNGDIPKGKLLCHKCDNRSCVNPNHMFIGTHQDNMDDMVRKGRSVGRKPGNSGRPKGNKDEYGNYEFSPEHRENMSRVKMGEKMECTEELEFIIKK